MSVRTLIEFLLDAGVSHAGIAALLPVYMDMTQHGPIAVEVK